MKRWKKRLVISLAVLAVMVCIGGAGLMYKMQQWDVQHSEFLSCGKTINDFLKTYAENVSDAFEANDAEVLVQHYSKRFASPGRGTWSLNSGEDIGDIDYFKFEKTSK